MAKTGTDTTIRHLHPHMPHVHKAMCLNMLPHGMVWWTPRRTPEGVHRCFPLQLKYDLDLHSYDLYTKEQTRGPAIHPRFQNWTVIVAIISKHQQGANLDF